MPDSAQRYPFLTKKHDGNLFVLLSKNEQIKDENDKRQECDS